MTVMAITIMTLMIIMMTPLVTRPLSDKAGGGKGKRAGFEGKTSTGFLNKSGGKGAGGGAGGKRK